MEVRAVYGCPPPYRQCAATDCTMNADMGPMGMDSAGRFHGPYCTRHQQLATVDPCVLTSYLHLAVPVGQKGEK